MATNDFSFESLMNSIKEINTRAGCAGSKFVILTYKGNYGN